MGDFAAHLNQWLDQDQPTLFELVAQRDLGQTLRPALEHFLKVLANHFPTSLWPWAWRHTNEVFLGVELLLQHYYLKHFGASFAENFYSLRRVPCTCQSPKPPSPCCGPSLSPSGAVLCRYHLRLSLFFVTVAPYLKQKLEDFFESLDAGQSIAVNAVQWRRFALRLFLTIYPYFHFAWEGLFFAFQLAYLLKRTPYFSPLLYLAGIELRRVTEQDEKVFEQAAKLSVFGRSADGSLLWRAAMLPLLGAGQVVGLAASGLPVLAFLLKFVEWWRSDEGNATRQAARSTVRLPIPPPPTTGSRALSRSAHPILCPICGQVRRNSTALAVSGFVFCYTCLHTYITRHGRCPVTHIPTSINQMVRIFAERSS